MSPVFTLVIGYPGAGKTSYVRSRLKEMKFLHSLSTLDVGLGDKPCSASSFCSRYEYNGKIVCVIGDHSSPFLHMSGVDALVELNRYDVLLAALKVPADEYIYDIFSITPRMFRFLLAHGVVLRAVHLTTSKDESEERRLARERNTPDSPHTDPIPQWIIDSTERGIKMLTISEIPMQEIENRKAPA